MFPTVLQTTPGIGYWSSDAPLTVGLVREVLMSLGYGFMTLVGGLPSFQRMFPQIFRSKNILSDILIVTERWDFTTARIKDFRFSD
ncbi:MAG: hypothetical protein LKKZDAJK_003014 [Candidatus Fervidibacter sp.]